MRLVISKINSTRFSNCYKELSKIEGVELITFPAINSSSGYVLSAVLIDETKVTDISKLENLEYFHCSKVDIVIILSYKEGGLSNAVLLDALTGALVTDENSSKKLRSKAIVLLRKKLRCSEQSVYLLVHTLLNNDNVRDLLLSLDTENKIIFQAVVSFKSIYISSEFTTSSCFEALASSCEFDLAEVTDLLDTNHRTYILTGGEDLLSFLDRFKHFQYIVMRSDAVNIVYSSNCSIGTDVTKECVLSDIKECKKDCNVLDTIFSSNSIRKELHNAYISNKIKLIG